MVPSNDESRLITQLELARQLLHLEQQVEAYQRLYDEELDQIRCSLTDCRKKLLTLLSAGERRAPMPDSSDTDEPDRWEPRGELARGI